MCIRDSRCIVQVALAQTHAASVFEIDGGDQQHGWQRENMGLNGLERMGQSGVLMAYGCQSTKLRYRRKPCSALFSGWN